MLSCSFVLAVCRGAGEVLQRGGENNGRLPAPAKGIAFGNYKFIRQFGIPDMRPMLSDFVPLFPQGSSPKDISRLSKVRCYAIEGHLRSRLSYTQAKVLIEPKS